MKDEEIEILAENEREWRKHILKMQVSQTKEINDIKKSMGNLRVTVAAMGSFFGVIGSYLKSKLGM